MAKAKKRLCQEVFRLKYARKKPSIKTEITKDTGNHTRGDCWSRTSKAPFMIPETRFMITETIMERRNGFQLIRVRATPSSSAISRFTTIRARKPRMMSRIGDPGPVISKFRCVSMCGIGKFGVRVLLSIKMCSRLNQLPLRSYRSIT